MKIASYSTTIKAGSETPLPIAGDFFIVESIVQGNQAAKLAFVKTDSGDYLPLKQGEGAREAFGKLTVKNPTIVDFVITIVYGTGLFISNVSYSEIAHTIATADEITLDASGGPPIATIFIPGLVKLSNGVICRRKSISIQNIDEPTVGAPLSIQAASSMNGFGGTFDSTVNDGVLKAMIAAGFVFSFKVTGQSGRGMLIPLDATGAAVRTLETDSPVIISTKAGVGAVNKVLLYQTWYLLNA